MDCLKDNDSKYINNESLISVIRPFKCTMCDLIFDRISQLDNHKRSVHNKERSNICQICGKGFFRGTDLKTHLNIHLGINRCVCEICGKKFNHISNLIRHGRTHSGVKPYPCTICGKRFTQINTLARHKSIHVRGDETYDCSYCDKKYKTRNGLREHMKKLHGFTESSSNDSDIKIIRRKHYCKICGESFQFVELLRSHENIHIKRIIKVETKDGKILKKKFDNFQNIEDNECKKFKNLIDSSVKLKYENIINEDESLIKFNLLSKRNDIDNLINEKIINDNETKETIVYLRTEQLGCNLNTDQLVIDTANHYLNEHLLELTNDNVETEETVININVENCEDETVVSEMIKNCWNEIEMPDNNNTTVIRLFNNHNYDKNIIYEKEEDDEEEKEKEEESMLKLVELDERRENKNDKIIYYAQNNSRDCLVDLFKNDELCGYQENNSFNKITEEFIKENFDNTTENINISNNNNDNDNDNDDIFGRIEEKSLNYDNNKLNEKSNIVNGPMVRLVQNEEGEQFFELIRGDLEEEEEEEDEEEEEEKEKFEKEKEELEEEKLEIQTEFEFIKNNKKLKDDEIIVENYLSESILKINKYTDDDDKRNIDENLEIELSTAPSKKRLKNNDKKYNCDVCKKSFSKGYNYRQHIGTHFVDKQKFKCKECGQLFAWKSTLNKHIASHKAGGQQKFVCKICPKVYTTLSQVNEHVKRDHLKERNHECPHCAKTFFKKFDLKIHIRTHTKERPYECRVCYKSFHHQSHIIRHERIHSGEKPYACNICDKTFTQLGSMKSHRQRHKELKIDILDYQMDEDDPLPQTTL